jgi:prepilin-type N-terminal cleavage/methylation domain-containing protein
MHDGPSRARGGVRPGFTLVEVTVSLMVMSVLVGALASAIIVALHALPRPNDRAAAVSRGATVAGRIAAELQEARHFAERDPHAVTFTVADRDGDGSPERIRYAWSGTPGDPLQREYGGGAAVTLVEDVHVFDLDFTTTTADEAYPGVEPSTDEMLLTIADAGDASFRIESGSWGGQFIDPAAFLPPEAVAWTLTKVAIRARKGGAADGDTSVQIRPATDAGTPSDHVLASKTIPESALTAAYQWYEIVFDDREVVPLTPDAAICLVLAWEPTSAGRSAVVEYLFSGSADRLESQDDGSSWTRSDTSSLRYALWGTYSVAGSSQTVTRRFGAGVDLSLQISPDSNARIDTAAHLLNPTEALSAYWELDFETDPRALDVNADRTGDWESYTAPFDPADLIDGVWHAPDKGVAGIRTAPDEPFAALTTIELRGRATAVGAYGPALWINADPRGGAAAGLVAALHKMDAASPPRLWLGIQPADGGDPWVAMHDVPDDMVDVRLVIDPASETIAAFVDTTHKGTYGYVRGVGGAEAKAWLYTQDCSAEFDHVSIKVSDPS